jgi:hypothetical protein
VTYSERKWGKTQGVVGNPGAAGGGGVAADRLGWAYSGETEMAVGWDLRVCNIRYSEDSTMMAMRMMMTMKG